MVSIRLFCDKLDKKPCLAFNAYLLGLSIPLIAIIFVGTALVMAQDWFDWRYYALSNLGASEDTELVFNLGLMICGILILVFSFLILIIKIDKDKLFAIPAIILLLSGIALFGIGYYPMDSFPKQHWDFSVAFFWLIGIGTLIFGVYYLYRKTVVLGALGVIGFIVVLAVWVLIPWESLGITGVAIPEALSVLIPLLWIVLFSRKELKFIYQSEKEN